ncbi:MAG: 4Fe-4S dicluster domain-containing protein, partial [Planctomycetes bacterium]|nr:4Fe-4S dicluster domain-containing protein [Planctomycetota bacterium]
GCGACVPQCNTASALHFVSAKLAQYAHLPQGQPERMLRTRAMVDAMDHEGFGNCTNQYECEAVCPKEIPARFIAQMNRDFARAAITED